MNKKTLLRLLVSIIVGVLLSSIWHCLSEEPASSELPKTFFGVHGILFPVALAIVTSIDLMKVKNKSYRTAFRKNIIKVRTSLIAQFILSVISISVVLLFRETKGILLLNRLYLDSSLLASAVIGYAILHTIYNYILLQRFKDELEDKLQQEGA